MKTCEPCGKMDWLTTLKFDRDPSMVIYLPTKFERDWMTNHGKVIFVISSDPVQQTLTFDLRRWNFKHFVYSPRTLALTNKRKIGWKMSEKCLTTPIFIWYDLATLTDDLRHSNYIQSLCLIKDYQHAKFDRDRLRNDGETIGENLL